MSIVKFAVSAWSGKPERKEYSRETEHFYMHANGRGRDAKISRYDRYFDTLEEAQQFMADRYAARIRSKEIDQIKRHAVELLEALESSTSDLFYQIESKHGAEVASKYPSILAARSVIAKAKGVAQ